MDMVTETLVLCVVLFSLCYWGTGTDEKNLKSYSSYPDEVQDRIKNIAEYQRQVKDNDKMTVFLANLLLFLVILFLAGLFIREKNFWHNFFCLSVMGQGMNLFDLLFIDLLWWRNTARIRFTRIPEKELYHNPRKHFQSFGRAFIMYLFIAFIDGFLLTLF